MTARDDHPQLAALATENIWPVQQDATRALDEIDRLRGIVAAAALLEIACRKFIHPRNLPDAFADYRAARDGLKESP